MLFEAGFVTLFRTILIFVCVYYAFKFIMRFLAPILINRFLKKQQAKYQEPQQQKKKPGEVHIKKGGNHDKSEDVKLGDYVEFEDLDEKK